MTKSELDNKKEELKQMRYTGDSSLWELSSFIDNLIHLASEPNSGMAPYYRTELELHYKNLNKEYKKGKTAFQKYKNDILESMDGMRRGMEA